MTYFCDITEEADLYTVYFPDMTTVRTFGDSMEQALEMAKEALEGNLEVCIDHGIAIPAPQYKEGHPIEVSPKLAFAIQLRQARSNRTQKEIAIAAGMSYQQYQRLENPHKTNPTLEMLYRLQKVFGVPFLTL